MTDRRGRVERKTTETHVVVDLVLDGTGETTAATGVPFFDHMLAQLGTHAGFDLRVETSGDLEIDAHHTVEDTGIALGEALAEALGDKAGVRRYGDAVVPMEEALCRVALDLSGRPYLSHDVPVPAERVGEYDPGLTEEFLRALCRTAGLTLHVKLLDGRDPHHIVEAEFKALAVALGRACSPSGRPGTPSTKGTL